MIAAIHSACVGGGVDMTAACDVRYATEDAWFQIKVWRRYSGKGRFCRFLGTWSMCVTEQLRKKWGSIKNKILLKVSHVFPRRNPQCIEKSAKAQLQRDPFQRVNEVFHNCYQLWYNTNTCFGIWKKSYLIWIRCFVIRYRCNKS